MCLVAVSLSGRGIYGELCSIQGEGVNVTCVSKTYVVKSFIVHKVIDVEVPPPFLDFGRERMLRNPTIRSLSVVCLVIMFPKRVFSSDVISLRVLVFDLNLRVDS